MYRFTLSDRQAPAVLHTQNTDGVCSFSALRIAGMATLVLGALGLGLYAGLELRIRYKFRHRTPSDFFSNAGDPLSNTEYGMGV